MRNTLLTIGLLFIINFVSAQPYVIKEIPINSKNLTAVGSTLFFTSGDSLFKSDGTAKGTVFIKSGFKGPGNLFAYNGLLYFLNDLQDSWYDTYNELWRSDGTSTGTFLLSKSTNGVEIHNHSTSFLYFTSADGITGTELYRTNGTLPGTLLLKDINPGNGSGSPQPGAAIGNFYYFSATNPNTGTELWKSDGTSSGTTLVKDINPGPQSGFIQSNYYGIPDIVSTSTSVFFVGNDGIHGNEIWKSDGTNSGTNLIKDLDPKQSRIDILDSYNNSLMYYSKTDNDDGSSDFYLYITDGTSIGTKLLYHWANQDLGNTSLHGPYKTYNGKFYFFHQYGTVYAELWSTNGTAAGTALIKDIGYSYDGGVEYMEVVNNQLVFFGSSQGYYYALWKSDGTTTGTTPFTTFSSNGRPIDLTKVGNKLYYGDNEGNSDYTLPDNEEDYLQLFQTDITTTQSLRSIYGIATTGTQEIENVNGKIFFITYDDYYKNDKNKKLWAFDPNQAPSCTASGSILREFWANVPGYPIANIPVSTTPTSTSKPSLFEGPSNIADAYGERYRGYICPPTTGNYTFFISSDDNSELWLSTDADPKHKVKIASVTGYTNPRQWDKYPSQKSSSINLIAGRKYYIEALHKEYNGGDHIAVGWQLPNGTQERPIPGSRLSPFTSFPNNPPIVSITSPVNEQSYTAQANIIINASASDAGGSISKVEFFQGITKLGEDLTAPYSITWSNVAAGAYSITAKATDDGGAFAVSSAIAITVTSTGTACTATGNIAREFWYNVSGYAISSIPVNTTPSSTETLSLFEGSVNKAEAYGSRIRGYLCVPTTGAYTFWIASDDNSELWLSTNDNPTNKVKIASVSGWTSPRQWDKYASQKSIAINLMAGQKYYIEALHKEATGDDHISVGWTLPNGSQERPIGGNRLSPFNGGTGNTPPTVSITSPSNGQSYSAPANITINATASDAGGSISKVEFFQGSTKLGEDLTSPYSFAWSSVAAGSYSITAKATDNGGAQTTSATIAITISSVSATCSATGTLTREVWNNINGTAITSIPVSQAPNSSSSVTNFQGPYNAGDNYGARYRGYICAPITGNYTFWIASDESSELYLSTTDNPANKVRIAYLTSATTSLNFNANPSQKSALIPLIAGKRYYIEALHKEATGQDHIAVGWTLPNGTYERPIPGSRLSPYTGTMTLAKVQSDTNSDLSSMEVIMYPNPVQKGDLSLSVIGYDGKDYKVLIEILTIEGLLIYSKEVVCDITCPKSTIPINDKFKTGIYIVNTNINGRVYTQRLLIE